MPKSLLVLLGAGMGALHAGGLGQFVEHRLKYRVLRCGELEEFLGAAVKQTMVASARLEWPPPHPRDDLELEPGQKEACPLLCVV